MPDEQRPPERFRLKLDPTVNYGHLFSASVFLVTAAMAWANLSNRQDEADRRIARLERTQEVMTNDNAQEARVIARLDEKIVSLDRVLLRIERLLDNRPSAAPASAPARAGGD